jgi:hypothetical protein
MRGIVTIATGSRKYKAWATALGRSLARHYPAGNYHLITDTPGDVASGYFTSVSKLDSGMSGLAAKLRLDLFSPFEETLFVDADSLVLRPLDFAFKRFEGISFGLLGDVRTEGHWYGDIEGILRRIDCEWLPKFNSGLIYFRKDELASRVFQLARDAADKYVELGLSDPYGRVADEPCFAIAMARCGIRPLGDDGTIMRTPIGSVGPLDCDPLKGYCKINSHSGMVDPAVVHFVSLTGHRSYASARFKLQMAEMGLPHGRVINMASTFLAFWWAAARKLRLIRR